MTDNELRQLVAHVFGWAPSQGGGWEYWDGDNHLYTNQPPPPLDWTTAGALLELASVRLAEVDVRMGQGSNGVYMWIGSMWSYEGEVNARNVIEACVKALESKHD